MDKKESEKIIIEAFHLDEWIDGSADGGITPPRIILKTETNFFENGIEMKIDYKYPAESHPYSDVTYHMENPDKVYSSVYVLTDNREIYRKDCDDLFPQKDVFLEAVQPEIDEFFEKYGLVEADIYTKEENERF